MMLFKSAIDLLIKLSATLAFCNGNTSLQENVSDRVVLVLNNNTDNAVQTS